MSLQNCTTLYNCNGFVLRSYAVAQFRTPRSLPVASLRNWRVISLMHCVHLQVIISVRHQSKGKFVATTTPGSDSHVLKPETFLRNLCMRTWQYVCVSCNSVVKLNRNQLCVHVAKSYAVSKEEVIWRATHDRRTLWYSCPRGVC